MTKAKRYIPGDFDLRIKRAATGRGLFSMGSIPKGACIIEYTGKPVSREDQERNNGKYLFWTSDTDMIDGNVPGNKARFINHSCRPNCITEGPDGKIYVVSLRAIKPGEELTFDYGDEYLDRHITPHGCRCAHCENKRSKRAPATAGAK